MRLFRIQPPLDEGKIPKQATLLVYNGADFFGGGEFRVVIGYPMNDAHLSTAAPLHSPRVQGSVSGSSPGEVSRLSSCIHQRSLEANCSWINTLLVHMS